MSLSSVCRIGKTSRFLTSIWQRATKHLIHGLSGFLLVLCFSLPTFAQNASTFIDVMSTDAYKTYQDILNLHDAGQFDVAQSQALVLLESARARAHLIDEAAAQRLIGLVAVQRNQYDLALQAFTKAQAIFEQAEEFLLLAKVISDIGNVKQYQAEYSIALTFFYNALSFYQSLSDVEGVASQKHNIGIVLEQMGQFEAALDVFNESLNIQRQQNDIRGIGRTLYIIAEIYRDLGDLDRALTFFEDALAISQQLNIKRNIANAHAKIGIVLKQQMNYPRARTHLQTAADLFTQLNAPRDTDWALAGIGEVMVGQGEVEQGIQQIEATLLRAIGRKNLSLVTEIRLALARVALENERLVMALEQANIGLQEARERAELKRQAEFEAIRVQIYKRNGDYEAALATLTNQKAIEEGILMQGRNAALNNLQSEAEYVRQEQSIALLQKNKAIELSEAEQRNMRNVTFLASAIVVLLLGFLLVSRQSHKVRNQQLAGIVKRRTTELERKNDELQQAYRTLEQMSLRDSLTGCYNRHFLEANLPAEIKRSVHSYLSVKRLGHPFPTHNDLICFLIDIDDFKQINDTYGHVSGDKFLVQFSRIISEVFRHSDLQIRWGGEEFLVICRNTPRTEASLLAERLRVAVSDVIFTSQEGHTFSATCSIGLSAYPLDQENPDKISWEQCFNLADECLYSSKQSGKNCWVGIINARDRAHQSDSDELVSAPLEKFADMGKVEVVTSLNNAAAINWHNAK